MVTFSFISADSSIALMNIDNFMNEGDRAYFQKSFSAIQSANTQYLILDLRDNPGGETDEAIHLFSYLTDSTFNFIGKSEVASESSILSASYLR